MFNEKQVNYIRKLFGKKDRHKIVKILRDVKYLTWAEAKKECYMMKYKFGKYRTNQ